MWVMHPCRTSLLIFAFFHILLPSLIVQLFRWNITYGRSLSSLKSISVSFTILKTFVSLTFSKTCFKIYKRICSINIFHNYPEAEYRILGSSYSFDLTSENPGHPILSNPAIERAWLWNVLKNLSSVYRWTGSRKFVDCPKRLPRKQNGKLILWSIPIERLRSALRQWRFSKIPFDRLTGNTREILSEICFKRVFREWFTSSTAVSHNNHYRLRYDHVVSSGLRLRRIEIAVVMFFLNNYENI